MANFLAVLSRLISWISGPRWGMCTCHCLGTCQTSAHHPLTLASLPLWATYSTSPSHFCCLLPSSFPRTHTPFTPSGNFLLFLKGSTSRGELRACRDRTCCPVLLEQEDLFQPCLLPIIRNHNLKLQDRAWPVQFFQKFISQTNLHHVGKLGKKSEETSWDASLTWRGPSLSHNKSLLQCLVYTGKIFTLISMWKNIPAASYSWEQQQHFQLEIIWKGIQTH